MPVSRRTLIVPGIATAGVALGLAAYMQLRPVSNPVPSAESSGRARHRRRGVALALAICGLWHPLPAALERGLARSGLWGALVLGALIGTVMSPCATPALAAALALAGSGSAFGTSMWWIAQGFGIVA